MITQKDLEDAVKGWVKAELPTTTVFIQTRNSPQPLRPFLAIVVTPLRKVNDDFCTSPRIVVTPPSIAIDAYGIREFTASILGVGTGVF
jgi:hypothetical protein